MAQAILDLPGDDGTLKAVLNRTISTFTGNISEIGNYAFCDCVSLTYVNISGCSQLGSRAFEACTRLSEVYLPDCTYVSNKAFSGCTELRILYLPMISSIYSDAFTDVTGITSMCLGYTGTFSSSRLPFSTQTKLQTLELPRCTSIAASAFRGKASLATLKLSGTAVVTLANSNAFSNTGIGSRKGSIYVPASLYNSYLSARYWSYFKSQILSY